MKHIFGSIIATSTTFSFITYSWIEVVKANKNIPTAPISTEVNKLPSFEYKNFEYKSFDFWVEQCRQLDNSQEYTPQKYTEALIACEKAIALKPKKKNLELWTARSNALLNLGKYSDALISYEQVLQKEPNNSSLLTRRCQTLLALGRNEDAILSCETALKVNGNWESITPATTWYSRGLAFKKLNRDREAMTSFERATLIKPNYSLAFAQICGVFIDLKLYQKAIAACNTAIEKNGDWGKATAALAWKNKAVALTRLGKLAEAVNAYKQGLKINSQDAIAWYEQGKLLQKLRQYDRALAAYNMAIEVKPKYSQALARRVETLNKLQNYELALKTSDKALAGDRVWSEDTTLAYLWNQRSTALINLRKYEESHADSERAIALKQDYAEAWNNKAVSLWNLGKYQEAEKASLKATSLNDKYSQALFNRGRILSSLGQRESSRKKAIKFYQQALKFYEKALKGEIEKEDNFTRASIWNNKGVALLRLKKYVSALSSINKATKTDPKSFAAWYNKGLVIIEWQRFKPNRKLYLYRQALHAYNKANEINPNNSAVLTGRAITLTALGRDREALKYFEKALNINPDNSLAQQERENLLNKFKVKLDDG